MRINDLSGAFLQFDGTGVFVTGPRGRFRTPSQEHQIMKTLKTFIVAALVGGGFLLTPALSAADGQEGGLIGKRYAGGDFSYEKFHSSRFDDAVDGGAVLNDPLTSNL